jgi:hypothetical protein
LLWQLVLVSGNADKLTTRHQFRIFITQGSFLTDAPKMTDGVSGDIARIIERQQTFARLPNHPADDLLWLLHQLNITDKHRLVPLSVVGIDVISANSNNLPAFTVQSPDGPHKEPQRTRGSPTAVFSSRRGDRLAEGQAVNAAGKPGDDASQGLALPPK